MQLQKKWNWANKFEVFLFFLIDRSSSNGIVMCLKNIWGVELYVARKRYSSSDNQKQGGGTKTVIWWKIAVFLFF